MFNVPSTDVTLELFSTSKFSLIKSVKGAWNLTISLLPTIFCGVRSTSNGGEFGRRSWLIHHWSGQIVPNYTFHQPRFPSKYRDAHFPYFLPAIFSGALRLRSELPSHSGHLFQLRSNQLHLGQWFARLRWSRLWVAKLLQASLGWSWSQVSWRNVLNCLSRWTQDDLNLPWRTCT